MRLIVNGFLFSLHFTQDVYNKESTLIRDLIMKLMFVKNKEKQRIKRAISGDAEAFAALLAESYMMIYAVAYKWIGNKEDAEDIAQEVCIKLGKSLPSFRMEAKFSTWLYRITLNSVYDFQRKQQKNIALDGLYDVISHTEPTAHAQIENQEIWQYVHKLPPKQKDAILLVYSEELSHKEAALIMQCKESTISWYIFEAKKQLKLMVNDDEKI